MNKLDINYLYSEDYQKDLGRFVQEKSTLSKKEIEEKGRKFLKPYSRQGLLKLMQKSILNFIRRLKRALKKLAM